MSLWGAIGMTVAILFVAHLTWGLVRFCGIIRYEEDTVENWRTLLIAQMFAWSLADLREWQRRRSRRRLQTSSDLDTINADTQHLG